MEAPDIAAIIAALEQAAEQNNGEAAYRLGLIYANGDGIPLDFARAAARFRQAGDQGHGAALRALAMLHSAGYGVRQDLAETRRLLVAAAKRGDVDAQFAVGAMFHFGHHGAEPGTQAMLHWYQQAAEQGHAKAQFALGKLLAAGDRVQANDEAAFQWLSLAILNGSEAAKKELAMLTARIESGRLEGYKQRMMELLQGNAHG